MDRDGPATVDLKQQLDRVFFPRVIAVVGAKRDNDYMWLRAHGPFREHGKVYHVNIDQREWAGAEELGFTNVPSLLDIPEPVDYVAISVPNKVTPLVLRDCAAKQVGGAHIFASGFAEMDNEEGRELEATVGRIAREGDFALIGPNCMGIYHPALGIRPGGDMPYGQPGYFSYISQSGTTSMAIGSAAPAHGIAVAKGISFGNGTTIDSPDYLRYLADDDATEIIGMYLEGVRNGPQFFEALRFAAGRKPVLIWKVGSTPESARAGLSHTGSAPIPADLWDAMLKVAGAVKVNSIEEMLDTAMALRYVRDPGLGAALIAVSGGHSGKIADVFAHQGFLVPPLSGRSLERVAEYAELAGGSYANPIEGPSVRGNENMSRMLNILAEDGAFDCIVVEFGAGSVRRDANAVRDRIEVLQAYRERHLCAGRDGPQHGYTVRRSIDVPAMAREFTDAGLPCFQSMERGAIALRSAREYARRSTWLLGR
ncbi:MAG: CoA-binding protein [Dehalococcoidia bacterium]